MSLINVGTKERNIGTGIVHNVCLFLSNRLRNTASIYNYLQVEHNLGMLDGHPGSQQVLAVQLEHSIIYLILLDPPWHALRSPWLPAGPCRSARTQHHLFNTIGPTLACSTVTLAPSRSFPFSSYTASSASLHFIHICTSVVVPDPHSFSFQDPDPVGENLRGKKKMQGKWKLIVILL